MPTQVTTPLSATQLASSVPSGSSAPAQILALQSPFNSPQSPILNLITNGVNPAPRVLDRLSSFPTEIYTLQPTDNLVRFLQVLLGPTGVGQIRNRILEARLAGVLQGANFYELDSFYGALFGFGRLSNEALTINPYTQLATYDQWANIKVADAQYRSRIDQFARAVSLGPSAIGIQLVAEAVLQTPCAIYESWQQADLPINTYGELQTLFGGGTTYGQLQVDTYGELQSGTSTQNLNRKVFTIIPFANITQGDAFALKQVIDILKPADSICNISTVGLNHQTEVAIRGVSADSSYWQLVQSIIPNPIYASAYQIAATPDSNGFFEVLRPPFAEYQGEEIVYNTDISGVSSYEINEAGDVTAFNVGDAVTYLDGVTVYYLANDALASRFFNLAGRLVHDGIMQASRFSANPVNVNGLQAAFNTATPAPPIPSIVSAPQTLYTDGMDLVALESILSNSTPANSLSGTPSALGVQPSVDQFWSTPTRAITDPTIEVLEVRLSADRLVNNITFEAAHYPQTITVQTYDEADSFWETVYTQSIYDSVPSSYSPVPGFPHQHPQHSAPNHWYQLSIDIEPQMTDRVRILLERNHFGSGPAIETLVPSPPYTQLIATPEPYSLAVRNMLVGYSVGQRSDLPTSPIFTTDALGSQVEWTVREELPVNAINSLASANAQVDVIELNYGVGTALSTDGIDLATVVVKSYPTPSTTYALGTDYNIATNGGITLMYLTQGGGISSGQTVSVSYNYADNPIPWRSGPQPSADSVVNFYLDTRTSGGLPQLIDGIYIDPLYTGPHCTVYCSNDTTGNLGFAAEATNLVPPVASNVGNLVPNLIGLQWPSTDVGFVEIDNTHIQFDPTQAWWIGTVFIPDFYSNSTVGQTIWDINAGLTLSIQPGSGTEALVTVETADTESAYASVTFSPGDAIYCAVVYLPEGTPSFAAGMYVFATTSVLQEAQILNAQGGELVQGPVHAIFDTFSSTSNLFGYYRPTEVVSGFPSTIFVGASPGDSPVPANMTLVSMVLKQEAPSALDIENYAKNYQTYTYISPYADVDPTGNTTNALLRFNVDFIGGNNVSGFVGGPGNFYSLLNWTPVLRDFIVQKGTMNIPPTLARFWKLEFTNLVAQPINSFVPITQTYQSHQGIMPALVQQPSIPLQNNPGSGPPGFENNISTAGGNSLVFGDSTTYSPSATPNPLGNAATSMQVSADLVTAKGLAENGWYWNYQSWHIGQLAPRFVQSGIHNYTSFPIQMSSTVGYFVGLISVDLFRTNYSSGSDQEVYDFTFEEETFFTGNTWNWTPGDLNTIGLSGFPTTVTSVPMLSTSSVVGVQFGTSQSDPIEIAYDDSFHSGALVDSDWQDPDSAHVIGDATLSYLPDIYSIQVTRNFSIPGNPQSPSEQGRILRPDVFPVFEMTSLTAAEIAAEEAEIGGLATALCAVGTQGTIWTAIRLTANSPLTSPLQLQLVDYGSFPSFTQTVLATTTFTPSSGQTVEQSLGYILGSVIPTGNPVFAQIIQQGPSTDNQWTVSQFSVFDEGIIWEFSNDGGATWLRAYGIRNNGNAMLSFSNPGTQLLWRALGTRAGVHLNAVRIRPVYEGVL